jgi:hypothetical protein
MTLCTKWLSLHLTRLFFPCRVYFLGEANCASFWLFKSMSSNLAHSKQQATMLGLVSNYSLSFCIIVPHTKLTMITTTRNICKTKLWVEKIAKNSQYRPSRKSKLTAAVQMQSQETMLDSHRLGELADKALWFFIEIWILKSPAAHVQLFAYVGGPVSG